jgi:hypothetical protein
MGCQHRLGLVAGGLQVIFGAEADLDRRAGGEGGGEVLQAVREWRQD